MLSVEEVTEMAEEDAAAAVAAAGLSVVPWEPLGGWRMEVALCTAALCEAALAGADGYDASATAAAPDGRCAADGSGAEGRLAAAARATAAAAAVLLKEAPCTPTAFCAVADLSFETGGGAAPHVVVA
jgi:hypothetical protein